MFTCLYLVVLLLCFWFVSQSQQQFCEHIWVLKFSSAAQSCPTPWTAARQASLSIINSRSSLKLTSIQSVMPSSPLILCGPLLLLPLIPPSIRVFSNESALCIRWPKYWSGLPFSPPEYLPHQPRDRTHISCISCTGRQILYYCATWKAWAV